MSSRYDRRDSGGSRHERREESRERRRSPGPSSRRSPSPSPKRRDDKELPECFGRIDEVAKDDESNILQRMTRNFVNMPLGSLTKCLKGTRKIKVWTRNFKEVRGICTGYVVAFDKHWNLLMSDVDEVYLKPRKAKTPFLDDLNSAESYAELPKKVPKTKKEQKEGAVQEEPPAPPPAEPAAEPVSGEGGEKKKKRRKKKKGPSTNKRHIKQVFVRGDNIVMAAILEVSSDGE